MADFFLMKKHVVGNTVVLAVCDQDIFGKTVEENEVGLAITAPFYGGEKASLQEILDEIKQAATTNIVGNKIIAKFVEKGVLKERGILQVKGIKHAHIYKV